MQVSRLCIRNNCLILVPVKAECDILLILFLFSCTRDSLLNNLNALSSISVMFLLFSETVTLVPGLPIFSSKGCMLVDRLV